ncbi:hypothetical protein [Hyphomicrobium sp. D-2]|uniref:hypothetical protein n=1 Tax=Hyphomicrobium sp. D-2 TaxID=3041621 RepID=UPI00245727F9|nr:hypothetical protein [Hyphomicrobium sp. D-2]MDH4982841.1 hypothetical protein [Hyphomicrobium sp. D-2]
MTTPTTTVRHIRPLVLAIVASALFGATALHAEEPPFVGTWSLDPAQCSVGQASEDAPYVFTASTYERFERRCTFTSLSQHEGGWKVSAQCSAEGTQFDYNFTLTVSGDTLTFRDSSFTDDLLRCK